MSSTNRQNLVAPCGIDCGTWEVYLSRNSEEMKSYLIQHGIPADKVPCEGCRPTGGDCPLHKETCPTYVCATDHQVKSCHECGDFPCSKLNPASDLADRLPHNLKVFNLSVIRGRGAGNRCFY